MNQWEQIHNHAGKESRLGRAEEETRAIQLERRADETGQGRERTPGDESECTAVQPCAPAFHKEGTGNLQREIADEENPAGRAEDRIAQTQVAFHAEGGIGDVGAVEIVRDVEEKKKRQEPPGDATARPWPRHPMAENSCMFRFSIDCAAHHSGLPLRVTI